MNRLRHFARLGATATVTGLLLCGCAVEMQLASRLDSTGLTVVTLHDPVVLALPVHQLSATARDYAFLGPVEINRMGSRDYFLWVGLASTIDRKLAGIVPAQAQVLALLIDGQPMMLPLIERVADLDQSPYIAAAPLYATFAARASQDLIRRIANAESVDVYFVSASGTTRRYRKWQGDWSSWSLLAGAR